MLSGLSAGSFNRTSCLEQQFDYGNGCLFIGGVASHCGTRQGREPIFISCKQIGSLFQKCLHRWKIARTDSGKNVFSRRGICFMPSCRMHGAV
jgi:hypothetical protein